MDQKKPRSVRRSVAIWAARAANPRGAREPGEARSLATPERPWKPQTTSSPAALSGVAQRRINPLGCGRRLRWVAVLALAVAAWQGTLAMVRAHVTGKIEASLDHPLPAFALPTTAGGRIDSNDLRGKVVVLNFFRSRCHSCELEADAVRAFAAEMHARPDVVVLGVLLDRVMGFSESDSAATLARHAYTHPVLVADAAFVDAFHGVGWANVTPVTYVARADGKIVAALRGHQTLAALRDALP